MHWMNIFLGLTFIALSHAEKKTFHDYTVYSITPRDTACLNILKEWEETRYNDFNFWSSVTNINNPVDIMVPPEFKNYFENTIRTMGMSSRVFIRNVQELIDNENGSPLLRVDENFGWDKYHTLDEINNWLQQLEVLYPGNVTIIQAGESYEKRPILGVKLSFKDTPQKSVFIEANIHAGEWITSATATFILNELLTSKNSTVRSVAESYDWYIFPVTNPDGFVYTHTTDRMWRKTRSRNGLCYGADPNRNWGYRWNTGGSSNSPCSNKYHGARPFFEPSVLSLAEYISNVARTTTLIAYISFHSYAQMFLVPYGHTTDHLDNYDDMVEVGRKARDALSRRYGTEYVVGNVAETIYIATGSSSDWVKGIFKTPIVFTYELRDKGTYGHLLPANEIIPTGEETLDSLLTILTEGQKYI